MKENDTHIWAAITCALFPSRLAALTRGRLSLDDDLLYLLRSYFCLASPLLERDLDRDEDAEDDSDDPDLLLLKPFDSTLDFLSDFSFCCLVKELDFDTERFGDREYDLSLGLMRFFGTSLLLSGDGSEESECDLLLRVTGDLTCSLLRLSGDGELECCLCLLLFGESCFSLL